jgi:hypothetical protein
VFSYDQASAVDGILYAIGDASREHRQALYVTSMPPYLVVRVSLTAHVPRGTCRSWLPRGMYNIKDLNPNVPTAIVVASNDTVNPPYKHKYDIRVSYLEDADITIAQVW